MKTTTAAVLLSALLASCATVQGDGAAHQEMPAAGADEGSAEEREAQERKVAELERKLQVKEERLAIARAELVSFESDLETRLEHQAVEVEMARADLAKFREVDAPHRVAQEQLDLRSSKDRAQEAADELAQIEIMYEDQDLDDLTAEFVVSRGRRNAERAAARLEIQEAAFRALEERELPQEEKRLQLKVDRSVADLEKAKREGEIQRRQKALAVQEAENAVLELKLELEDAREALTEAPEA